MPISIRTATTVATVTVGFALVSGCAAVDPFETAAIDPVQTATFDDLDADDDNFIIEGEFNTAYEDEDFGVHDRDDDGLLSQEEFAGFETAMR